MRYDYFLIWGNGLKYKNEIINEIQIDSNFQIVKIVHHNPKSIKKLIKVIYSYDYAPFWHLKSKTKYLKKTVPEVEFIFVKNINPREDYFGEGTFRHIESQTLKRLKETIRNKYNQRKNDRRTENHVIHASDNEGQTDYILKYLGYKEGLNYLKHESNKILSLKYYLPDFLNFTITTVDINQLYCNILKGNRDSFSIKRVSIADTPQFKSLSEKTDIYYRYLETFLGGPLTDNYSLDNFINLSKNFCYLEGNYSRDYILVKRIDSIRYLILDGIHRASNLLYRGQKKVIVAIIERG
jgi:hypothetical protein